MTAFHHNLTIYFTPGSLTNMPYLALSAGQPQVVSFTIGSRMVKQFGRLRGRRMSAKIALSRRMEALQTEADRNSGFKHYPLRNWALSGA